LPSPPLFRSIDMSDLDPDRPAWELLVGEEVVLQALYESGRALVDLEPAPVHRVPGEDGDDLVVRLVAVDHAEAADRNRLDEDVAVRDVALTEPPDVERVAVAADGWPTGALGAERADAVSAVSLGDEAVERGTDVRELLWPVDPEKAGVLVELVFDGIRRDD